jgi:hypothetical protein
LMEDGREHAAPFVAVTSVPCDRKGERLIVLHTADLGDLEETLQRLNRLIYPTFGNPTHRPFIKLSPSLYWVAANSISRVFDPALKA